MPKGIATALVVNGRRNWFIMFSRMLERTVTRYAVRFCFFRRAMLRAEAGIVIPV